MRASELFRHSAVATVLLAMVLPVTLILSACGVGLPLWSLVVLAMLRRHFEAGGVRPLKPSMLAGFLLVVFLAALAMAAALGLSIAEHLVHDDVWVGLGAVVGPAVLLALLSPLSLVVAALLDPRCPTALHALRAALEGWSRLSLTRRLCLSGLPCLALVGVPYVTVADGDRLTELLVLALPVVIVGPITSLTLVSSWLEVREVAEDVEEARHVPRGSLMLGAVTAFVTVAVGVAVGLSLMTPVPMAMREFNPPRRIDQTDGHLFGTVPHRIEGTSLQVSLVENEGVLIEADDGGGVGRVEAPHGGGRSFRVRPLSDDTYRVILRDYRTEWYVDIDDSGVRIDDGLGARFSHHIGGFGLSLLLLLALGWLASVVAGVKLARAQTLGGIKASTDHRSADRRRVLEGTLRLAEGSSVQVEKRALRVKGSASIEGAGLRVRIPDRPVRVRGSGRLVDGAPIALVGTFTRLTSEGHRDATAPWPEREFVVPGGRELAVREEIRRASNLAIAAITPTLITGLGFLGYLGMELM